MATCTRCSTQETQLFQNGVPICLDCVDGGTKRKPPATDQEIRANLLQDVIELTARNEEATEEFEAATDKISGSPRPDGVQRIKDASTKLATARQELMKAHRRLDEHIHGGIAPEGTYKTRAAF